jgi:hypothetical protein
VCHALFNVARSYVEAKAQQQQDQEMTMVGNDFDMYLSQLGFMPPAEGGGGGLHPSSAGASAAAGSEFGGSNGEIPVPAAAANQAMHLGDWFSANRHIMGLMEEDLTQFEPTTVWSAMTGGP